MAKLTVILYIKAFEGVKSLRMLRGGNLALVEGICVPYECKLSFKFQLKNALCWIMNASILEEWRLKIYHFSLPFLTYGGL